MKKSKTKSACKSIAEQSIQEYGKMKRVEVGFLDTNKIYRREQNKRKKFYTSRAKNSCVTLENPERVRRGKEIKGVEEELEAEESWEKIEGR